MMDNDSPFAQRGDNTSQKYLRKTIHVNFCPNCKFVWKAPTHAEACVNCKDGIVPLSLASYESDIPAT